MLDFHSTHNHEYIENWGIRPVLFSIRDVDIPAYSFFVLLGILVGILVIYLYSKKENRKNKYIFELVLAGIVGGVLGAKIPIWIFYAPQIIASFPDVSLLLSGRTIVGGLIGGTLAVWYIKRKMNIYTRFGNMIVPGVVAGIAIGRIGCFLRGCCYGVQTKLPWGVDFGDGISRHPTQIYEILFLSAMFVYINFKLKLKPESGKLFDTFMIIYFSYRFMVEFIRVEPKIFLHLTMFQWLSLLIIIYFLFIKKKIFYRNK